MSTSRERDQLKGVIMEAFNIASQCNGNSSLLHMIGDNLTAAIEQMIDAKIKADSK